VGWEGKAKEVKAVKDLVFFISATDQWDTIQIKIQ